MRASHLNYVKKKKEEVRRLSRTSSYYELFDAIGAGNSRYVLNILQMSRDPIGLMQKKDLQGLTPLRKAIALSQGEIAMILVVAGADASQTGALNKQALHEAARMGQRTLLAPLLSCDNISVNVQDKFGMTPLHNAVRGRHIKAVEWLLFAGADVNALNNKEESPLRLVNPESEDETERQIYRLLEDRLVKFEPLELQICSGYVTKKQISNMGSDGSLMFITSDMWPDSPQFVFGIKILPDLAEPQIPLRLDELYYSYVFKYKLMYTLPENKRRVQIYFTVLEEFVHSELILKVCSKSRFLGEIPITITTYSHHKYINYLASCEMDLQNEGQFVLVKRPKQFRVFPDLEGILSISVHPLFKWAATSSNFSSPPPGWGKTRRQREWDECQLLIENLPERTLRRASQDKAEGELDESSNNNAVAASNKNTNAEDDAEEDHGESENDESFAILDWSEPDTCEDFYYISRGWAPYLENRRSMSVESVADKYPSESEDLIVRAISDFFSPCHPGNVFTGQCLMQIPKTPQFVKVGTVLVFQRQPLGPNETEDPYPDFSKFEAYLSDDGRHTNGKVWVDREIKRWNLVPSGCIHKPTRIIFQTNKLCTYVAVQLNIGEDKWELDSDESDSDDESYDNDPVEGEDNDGHPPERTESGEVVKKKRKRKKRDTGRPEGEDGEVKGNEENESNNKTMATNANNNQGQDDDIDTIVGGIEPSEEEFAIGLDKLGEELKEGVSSEDLGPISYSKSHSISINNLTKEGFVQYEFGPAKKEEDFDEDQMQRIKTQIALNWRCRNHREVKVLVFTRHKHDLYFDMVVELVQMSDLTVRAETRWSDGFRMVVSSPPFLTMTGKMFSLLLEANCIIESPADGQNRSMYFTSIHVNELEYVVKRKLQDEPIGTGKKLKKDKHTDRMSTSLEIDAYLEVISYPNSLMKTDGMEIMKLPLPLSGPNMWTEKHLQLKIPDNVLLDAIIMVMKTESSFLNNWWKFWILLYFEEKQVEVEKVKQNWAEVTELMLRRWFKENIDAPDRGISRLVFILYSLHLDVAHIKLLAELRNYKRKVINEIVQPRQLDQLFHWAKNTKMTTESFRRKAKEPPVMSPLSDQFLMYLNEVINIDDLFELGSHMEVEDNVINSINGEENITDPRYKTFKVFIKSRQKKDEIVGFTLMLTEMVTSLHQQEAYDFVVRETRRWMASVIDTNPDTCNKLENLLRTLTKTHETK